jgi:uncharacterized membrane protein (UPF0136 family)
MAKSDKQRPISDHSFFEVEDMTSWIVLIYAILVAVGGIMGYVKAQSSASLIAGVLSGLFLAGSAIAMMKGSYQAGWWIALIVTIVLLVRFGMAAMNEFKMMPGGMVIILSLIVLVTLLTNRGR